MPPSLTARKSLPLDPVVLHPNFSKEQAREERPDAQKFLFDKSQPAAALPRGSQETSCSGTLGENSYAETGKDHQAD